MTNIRLHQLCIAGEGRSKTTKLHASILRQRDNNSLHKIGSAICSLEIQTDVSSTS